MCGRFAIWSDKNKILEHYQLQEGPDTYIGYNVVPSYDIPVIRNNPDRQLVNCHWGLIPHWAKDTKLQPANEFKISSSHHAKALSCQAQQRVTAGQRSHSRLGLFQCMKLLQQQIFAKSQDSDPLLVGSQHK